MKALVVASTRPEVIKLAPVLWELKKKRIRHVFATTGQHYDELLFKQFIKDLRLDEPRHNIEVGSGSQAVQTGRIMAGIEEILALETPDVVVVEGDTNSVLGTALAAAKQKIPVAHVEAGLRSFDRTMPEELNRILTDHCSEVLFAPTEHSALNLINEGIHPGKIHIVGNTVVDATLANIPRAEKNSKALKKLPKGYLLLTLHRQENTDDPKRLGEILSALGEIERSIVFPIHPRTSKAIKGTLLERLLKTRHIHVIPPVGYLDFLAMLKGAFAVLTDSGGVQEEAIVLGVPCLTLRYNTERPETVWAGGNILVGAERKAILGKVALLEDSKTYLKMKKAVNPFGDGKTGERVVDVLVDIHKAGGLVVESSDLRKGFYSRKLVSVDKKMAGVKVKNSRYTVMKIIEDGFERFPFPESVLKEGMLIEVLTKGSG